jgi:mannose-6-phosphate isomerase class I
MKCDLFEEGVLDKAIESTGKLSELVEVVRDATLKAYRARKERISMIELESALEKLRMTYDRTLTEAHKKKLLEIYHSKEARDEDSDSLIIRELLFSLNAVEYYDSEGRWCTIDPLLLPLVEKWSRSPEKV